MKTLQISTLLVLASLASACGNQLVEFGLDGGDTAGGPPTVTATGPLNAAANVSVNKRVSATFSRMMAPATLNSGSFTVQRGPTAIAGVVSYAGTTATFVPNLPLGLSLQYTATITTGAADTLGRSLASNFVWSFTTGACSQAAVALGAAGNMAVLAGSTVTSTGPTAITGDLGLSPGTATSVTGFPPGNLMGVQHAGDSAAAVALGDLTTAYNDAAGRTLCAMTVAGNLGGQTLTPGLYKSTSSLAISSGDLTLDAQGDPDAVFIFQMASTLTTTSGRKVILSGGARAANVFWQVGSSATLGTTSVFQGTIMADQAITMATGATLNGRALARVDGVFLDSNTIVKTAL